MARGRGSSSKSINTLLSGETRTLGSLAQRPRNLSSIPRYRRSPEGFVINTDTGEILGNFPGRRPRAPSNEDFESVDFPMPVSTPRQYPVPGSRKPPGVPRRVAVGDLATPGLDVCIARYARRRVLFALGLEGRHGGGKRYRRSVWSDYGC